jgi:hypothetical protein
VQSRGEAVAPKRRCLSENACASLGPPFGASIPQSAVVAIGVSGLVQLNEVQQTQGFKSLIYY